MKIIGNGSITNLEKPKEKARCRKWRLKVITNEGPKTKRVSGTYTQAQKALDGFIAEIEAIPDKTSTFRSYSEKWLSYRGSCGNYANRTISKYGNHVRVLNCRLGNMELNNITTATIKDSYVAWRGGIDTPSGKPLSGTYLGDVHDTLRLILEEAITDGLLFSNPCKEIKKPRRDTAEKTILTDAQVLRFEAELDKIGITSHTIAVQLAVFAGLRRSEICALQWRDYDGRTLRVRHNAEKDGTLKKTKSKAGTRDIPLDTDMQRKLDEWYKMQASQFARFKTERTDETRIITTKLCEVEKPRNLNKWWERNRESIGAANLTLHELRHTYLTMLVHSGANLKAAQYIAGHSKIDVLMDIYTHRNRDEERRAVDAMMTKLKHRGTSGGTSGAL